MEDLNDKATATITRTTLTDGVRYVALANMSKPAGRERTSISSARTDLGENIGDAVALMVEAAEKLYDPDSGCNDSEFSYGDNRVILERHLGFWIAICVASGSSVGKSVRRMIRKIAKNLPRPTP